MTETVLDPALQINLPAFEGPLDLLLHLIQKHELDILDLPIAFVTERYVAYLDVMEELNLDIASEYLLMAATLAHIKSKMLLPTPPTDQDGDGEAIEEIDPREELVRRLLEYQKYKAAAENLGARGIAGRDVFVRGAAVPEREAPPGLAEIGLFALLDAFQGVLKRAKMDLARAVTAERISIQSRMTQIIERLSDARAADFDSLFEDVRTTYDVVVTFLAILEMAKARLLRIYQPENTPGSPIHLQLAVSKAEAEEAIPEATSDVEALDLGAPSVHDSSLSEISDPDASNEESSS